MKKGYFIFAFILLILSAKSQIPTFEWTLQISGTNFDYCQAMDVDVYGNVSTTGCFRGTVDIDPRPDIDFNPGTTNLSPPGLYTIQIVSQDKVLKSSILVKNNRF